MTIGVLKEPAPETRVSLLPEHSSLLTKMNAQLLIETGAGLQAYAPDESYKKAGAAVASREELLRQSDILLSIHPIRFNELMNTKAGVWIGAFQPLYLPDAIRNWQNAKPTIFSLDMLPRTTRAQSMDVLSSQANIAGYKAVLKAADLFPKYFPMFMTAAGSISPARVLILGAGVAGLQAIATARRLGAVVEVFDTRPAVKEEVMSLGAKFIEVEGAADASKAGGYAVDQSADFMARQQQRIAESVEKSDIIITTAQIPGKKAPLLITDEMLHKMKKGSVVIDLAAATGGNTSHTKNNLTVEFNGVRIVGDSSLSSSMPADASKVYGKNVCNFLQIIISKEGKTEMDFNDELVRGACIVHEGKLLNERVAALMA